MGIDQTDPVDWYLPPPKPKWMRWATYERHIDKYSRYEEILLKDWAAINARLSATLAA